MASLLLRHIALTSARFLNSPAASRSFFSWLPGRLQALTTPQLCAKDQPHVFTKCLPPILQPVAGFKNKSVLRRRCKDCYMVRRRGRLYIYCKAHPRHKQRKI